MRLSYRHRRDHLVEALRPFDVGIGGLSAGLHLLLTLPEGTEPDGIVVSFGTPAEHAFTAAANALVEVLARLALH